MAYVLTALVFISVHITDVIHPEPLIIGNRHIRRKDKQIGSGVISCFLFYFCGAIVPSILLVLVCFVTVSNEAKN